MINLDKKEVYKALESSETYATVLHAIALNLIGEDMYSMDSIEIFAELQDAYKILPHEDNESKLMAMIIAVSTPYFYTDLEVFNSTCKTLTTGDPGLTDLSLEASSLLDIFWGLYEVALNAEEIELSDSIKVFMDRQIDNEAVESNDPKVDMIESYNRVVREMSIELYAQLNKVGFSQIATLPKI